MTGDDPRISGAAPAAAHAPNTVAWLASEETRFLVRLHGVASIEVPFDGSHDCGMIDDPIFVDDHGDVLDPADPDVIASVNAFAEDRLADLGWDWSFGEGGCGTIWIDIEHGTYQVETYKRRVVMEAHLMSGSLAEPLSVGP